MTKIEFLEWMKVRDGKAGGWEVLVEGELINANSIPIGGGAFIGIRYVNGKWQVYEPQERGADDWIDIETTDENVAFDKLAEEIERKERIYQKRKLREQNEG